MKKGIIISLVFLSSLVEAAKTPEASAVDPLITALGDPHLHIQIDAMLKLEEMGKSAVPSLLRYLNSKNQTQQWRVLHLLAKQKRDEVIPVLKEIFKDPSTRKKRTLFLSTLYSFAWVAGSEETAFMLDQLKEVTFGDTDIILMGVLAFHKIAKTSLENLLQGIYQAGLFLESLESPRLKMISDAIKNVDMTESKILRLFRQKNAARSAGALFILRVLKPKGAEPYFLQSLRLENDPSILVQAILGVADYRIKRVFPKLLSLEKSENSAVQKAIKTAKLIQK